MRSGYHCEVCEELQEFEPSAHCEDWYTEHDKYYCEEDL